MRCTRHEEAIATGNQALDVARIRVGMAADPRAVLALVMTMDLHGKHTVFALQCVGPRYSDVAGAALTLWGLLASSRGG